MGLHEGEAGTGAGGYGDGVERDEAALVLLHFLSLSIPLHCTPEDGFLRPRGKFSPNVQ